MQPGRIASRGMGLVHHPLSPGHAGYRVCDCSSTAAAACLGEDGNGTVGP
jgi:hypothetical protein